MSQLGMEQLKKIDTHHSRFQCPNLAWNNQKVAFIIPHVSVPTWRGTIKKVAYNIPDIIVPN
jgi:hypothetical protein